MVIENASIAYISENIDLDFDIQVCVEVKVTDEFVFSQFSLSNMVVKETTHLHWIIS